MTFGECEYLGTISDAVARVSSCFVYRECSVWLRCQCQTFVLRLGAEHGRVIVDRKFCVASCFFSSCWREPHGTAKRDESSSRVKNAVQLSSTN